MKRVGFIYQNVYDSENIKQAIMSASIGKRKQKELKTYYGTLIIILVKSKNC